jgi:hypothetical protein
LSAEKEASGPDIPGVSLENTAGGKSTDATPEEETAGTVQPTTSSSQASAASSGFGFGVLKLTHSMDGAGGEVMSFRAAMEVYPSPNAARGCDGLVSWTEFPAVEMDDDDTYDWQAKCLASSDTEDPKAFSHEFEMLPPGSTDPVAVISLVDEEREVRYWTYCPLMQDNSAGQGSLNIGTRELKLFHPPVVMPNPPGNAENAEDAARLHVCVFKIGNPPSGLFGAEGSPNVAGAEIQNKQPEEKSATAHEQKEGTDHSAKLVGDDPFIEIVHGSPSSVPLFNPGDGFDVYVDAARFLPDNTTIPKVVARVMTHDLDFVLMSDEKKQESAVCNLTDDVFNPEWKLRLEYRRDENTSEKRFDPTSTLNVRVETIEELSKKVEVIGYCALNIFCKPGKNDPPENPTEREFVLNKGAHQVPLYYGAPNLKNEWSVHNLQRNPKVPCSTLLIRIEPAAKAEDGQRSISVHDAGIDASGWEEKGLLVPYKGYKKGDYDSHRCLPSDTEKRLYTFRRKQEAIMLRDRASKARRPKIDKWDDATVDDQTLQKWCADRMEQKPQDMLHPQGMVTHQPEAGFKFKVCGLYNVKKKAHKQVCKVIFCTNPPGAFYSDPKLLEDTHATMRHDWRSGVPSQKFLDDWTTFSGMKDISPMTTMILEVKALTLRTGKKKAVGSFVLASLTSSSQFCLSHSRLRGTKLSLSGGLMHPCILILILTGHRKHTGSRECWMVGYTSL